MFIYRLKAQPTPTPALKTKPSSSIVSIPKPPKSKHIAPSVTTGVEATPVPPQPGWNRGSHAIRLETTDDYFSNNGSLFEPVEPTVSAAATPPLPDSADLAGVGPNLIGLDEEEDIKVLLT